ncbi:AlbA family DNA-binding domain-containing protein [Streptomyces sp. NBC_00724]|uniref:AlbA family DNA-binding domain-containing protein n=1 Tax=Streptomyces sp. NBC_00724 TaxID=2975812 RepID=UPI002ECFD756|nr:ATP-binding protein [Streptomyces sp. NBC_00724]
MKDNCYIEERDAIQVDNGALIERDRKTHTFDTTADALKGVTIESLRKGMLSAREYTHGGDAADGELDIFVKYEPKDINLLSDWELQRLKGGHFLSETRTSSLLFTLDRGKPLRLSLAIDFPYTDNEEEMLARVGEYIRHSLGQLISAEFHAGLAEAPAWSIHLVPYLNLTVSQCTQIAHCVESLLRYKMMDPDAPEGAMALLLSGQASFLIGRPENAWLEAKQSYGISDKSQKHEFACDVTSFANSNAGGLIVIGVKTEKDQRSRDVITELSPCRAGSINLQTYQQAVADRVVPAIEGLSFDVVEVENGDLLVVRIPAQEESRMPFIVKGGVIDANGSKIRTTSFSIPVRRNADKEYMNPEWVHSLLVSGRAFLAYKPA